MKTANYSIRLDPDVKSKAEETYAAFGLNLSEAINVFLHMSIKKHGFPFEVTHRTPQEINDMQYKALMTEAANDKTFLSRTLQCADDFVAVDSKVSGSW